MCASGQGSIADGTSASLGVDIKRALSGLKVSQLLLNEAGDLLSGHLRRQLAQTGKCLYLDKNS